MKKNFSKTNLFITLILSVNFSHPTFADTAGSSSSGSAQTVAGEVITGVVGGFEASQCSAHWMACVLAAQCALQLLSAMSAKSGADDVTGAYSGSLGSVIPGITGDRDVVNSGAATPSTNSNRTNPSGTNPAGLAQFNKIQTALSNAGVALDPSTGIITLPNGTTVSSSATPSSLKGRPGFSASEVDQTMADEKKLEASLLAKMSAGAVPVGYQSMGGGGSKGANAVNPNASDDAMNKYLASINGKSRRPSSSKQNLAGLSRKLGSENIGVKGDDIFEMVNRRYQAQDKQNAFLREK